MRVAVTGATGFLGLHLLRELLDRHRTITVLSHAGSRGAIDRIRTFLEATCAPHELIRRLPERLRVVETDLTLPRLGLTKADHASLANSLDVLWHCAGDVRMDAPSAELRVANVEGTRRLLDLARAGRRRPRVMHISSAFVAGDRRNGTIKEELTHPVGGFENFHEQSKYEAEVLVREWAARHGRSVTILRPTLLVSDVPGLPGNALRHVVECAEAASGGTGMRWAARAPHRLRPTLRLAAAPDGRLNFMPVHEAAQVMTRLADLAGSGGVDTYHVRHPHDVPIEVVREVLAEFLPLPPTFEPVAAERPNRVERAADGLAAFLPYLLHRRDYDDSAVRALLGEPRSRIGVDRDYLVDCVRPGRGGRRSAVTEAGYLDHDRPGLANSAELGAVLRFRGAAPTVEDLRQAIAARLWRVPVLTYRTHMGRRSRGPVDLARHVHLYPVAADRLDAAVVDTLADRLPRDRPLWEARLVHGYAPGEWAFVFKAHHALLDGASVAEVGRRLFGVEPIGASQAAVPGPAELDVRSFASRFVPLSTRPFVTRGLTGTRRMAWSAVDPERIHTIGRRHGATVEEVFLAALSGALRDCPGVPWRSGVQPVWALLPAAARGTEPGAHRSPPRLRLPCAEADPARRLAQVMKRNRLMRAGEPARAGDGLPDPVARASFRAVLSPWHGDLAAGTVRWPRHAYAFRGSPAVGAVPFGMIPRGRPFGVFLATFEDTMQVTALVDTSLPTELATDLCTAWLDGL
jgi:nucleoside-diphosphate-sugar epimerase